MESLPAVSGAKIDKTVYLRKISLFWEAIRENRKDFQHSIGNLGSRIQFYLGKYSIVSDGKYADIEIRFEFDATQDLEVNTEHRTIVVLLANVDDRNIEGDSIDFYRLYRYFELVQPVSSMSSLL